MSRQTSMNHAELFASLLSAGTKPETTHMTGNRLITFLSILVAMMGIGAGAYAAPPAYYVTDLGALGGTNSYAWDLNAGGQVTGYATTAGDATVDAFLWTPTSPNAKSGSIKDLGTIGGTYAWGVGINVKGQVAGVSATAGDSAEHATLWNPTTPGGSEGTLHDLETLGGTYSQADAINASGQVTGYSDVTGDASSHAFLWNPTTPGGATGTMHDLGSLGGPFTIGWDINSRGEVTGTSDATNLSDSGHAFLWQPAMPNGTAGTMHDLGTLGGSTSDGSGINDGGQVAGSAHTINDAATHAFLWTPSSPGGISGAMQDLGTLGGLNSYGYAVSAAGQVVGLSEVDAQISNYTHAFLYTSAGGMVDLNTLIGSLPGWELLDAGAINSAGQITGQGLINDEYHAYLLTPVRAGDVNYDGIVNGLDIAAVASRWLQAGENVEGDANHDGVVNGLDIAMIASHWLSTAGGASGSAAGRLTVPEPSSFVLSAASLFSLAGAAHLRRRDRQNSHTAH
jgi:probable HAF family extracellular repeat protein